MALVDFCRGQDLAASTFKLLVSVVASEFRFGAPVPVNAASDEVTMGNRRRSSVGRSCALCSDHSAADCSPSGMPRALEGHAAAIKRSNDGCAIRQGSIEDIEGGLNLGGDRHKGAIVVKGPWFGL